MNEILVDTDWKEILEFGSEESFNGENEISIQSGVEDV